jgi:hypothetical protein
MNERRKHASHVQTSRHPGHFAGRLYSTKSIKKAASVHGAWPGNKPVSTSGADAFEKQHWRGSSVDSRGQAVLAAILQMPHLLPESSQTAEIKTRMAHILVMLRATVFSAFSIQQIFPRSRQSVAPIVMNRLAAG